MPTVAYLGVTTKCNLNCKHCYLLAHQKNKDMSFDDVKDILQKLYDTDVIKILYTHGELFLNKDYERILETANAMGFVQAILTNGMLLTPEICKIIEKNNVKQIVLSLDSADPAIHCENRNNPNAWDGLKNGVALLKQNTSCAVALNTVINHWVVDELIDIYDIATEWGADELKLLAYHPVDGSYVISDISVANKFIELLKHSADKKCKISLHHPNLSALIKSTGFHISDDHCGAGQDYVSIHTNGDFFPCNFIDIKLGNMLCDNSSDIQNSLNSFIKLHKSEPATACLSCSLFKLCKGGCLAIKRRSNTKCSF